MNVIEIINGIVVVIGVPTIVGVLISADRKLNTLDSIETDLKDNIRPDLKNIRERFAVVEDRVDTLWKNSLAPAHSPRQLNTTGKNILENSGIKEIIDKKKERLLELVREKNATTAYDAEHAIESVMRQLPVHCPDINDDLKNGAFKVGADIGLYCL